MYDDEDKSYETNNDEPLTEERLMLMISCLRQNETYEISQRIKKALASGALDISGYKNNFLLPKIILNAVYSNLSDEFYMNVSEHKAEVENLKQFL